MSKYNIYSVLLKHFLLTALLPVLLLSILLCTVNLYSNVEEVTSENMKMLTAGMWTVEERLNGVPMMPVDLVTLNGKSGKFSSDSLWNLLEDMKETKTPPIATKNFESYARIRNLINRTYIIKYHYIDGFCFLTPNGGSLQFGTPDVLRPEVDMEYMEKVCEYTLPCYLFGSDGNIYDRESKDSQQNIMTYVARIEDGEEQKNLAVLLIQFNKDIFEPLSNTLLQSDKDCYYVLDENGDVFYCDGMIREDEKNIDLMAYLGEREAKYDWTARKVVCSYALPEFTVVYTMDVGSGYFMGGSFTAIGCVVVLACIYAILMTRYSARKFSAPIIELQKAMEEDKSLEIAVDKKKEISEFQVLGEKYNELLCTIKQYMKEKYEQELLITRTRMKVLESQIDSHFLYNTLECVQSMALLSGADGAAKVTKSLSDMFRYTSKVSEMTVKVKDELEYVQDYITIQRARFGEKVNCIIKVEPKYLTKEILKMSLQPLVENSFKHGFKKSHGKYNIYITCMESGGKFQIRVSDSGVGMNEKRLEIVRNRIRDVKTAKESDNGVGLVNIEKRLKLYFGPEAGLQIESVVDEGTVVLMEIPLNEENSECEVFQDE